MRLKLRRLGSRLLEGKRVLNVLVLVLLVCLFYRHGHRAPAHRIFVPSPATDFTLAVSNNPKLTSTDASQPQYARTLCRDHGWEPFKRNPVPKPDGRGRRKVYDLFTINEELDWLEIRLNTTYEFVDFFVIVEGRKTFTGLDKSLAVAENWHKFARYHDKIIYHELDYPADFHPVLTWDYEGLQRNALLAQVFPQLVGDQAPTEGDVLVVADVDEIVRPEALVILRACEFPKRLTLRSKMYYYSFEWLHRGVEWPHPQATTYHGLEKTILPDDLRSGVGTREWGFLAPLMRWLEKGDLWNAGWHCSSCFATVAELLRKMESFSHMLLNAPRYRDRDRIVDRVRRGQDLWDREGEMYDRIEDNSDVPRPLRANNGRWKYLVNREGDSAGFSDYP